ncbi:ATP-binding protein, partial [bacterium]|nr:ATP-binding protein [bacterium]MBU1025464.1 ATP-binding protein [bacterium]
MIENLLTKDESKTVEFKQDCKSLTRIIQTAVAFANTAGGTIVIGIQDKTKIILGIQSPLKEEERLANAFADNISPLLLPNIQIFNLRKK